MTAAIVIGSIVGWLALGITIRAVMRKTFMADMVGFERDAEPAEVAMAVTFAPMFGALFVALSPFLAVGWLVVRWERRHSDVGQRRR